MTTAYITYTHKPEAYQTFAHFKKTEELNTAFEMWLADHKQKFGKKELQALKTLVRYSAKVAGIATIKFKTLVSVAQEKFGFTFNIRTAKRAVEKARGLGMLRTLETRKANTNLKGPSIYIWQPYTCQNVTTGEPENVVEQIAKECEEIKQHKQQKKNAQPQGSQAQMSPHKAIKIKAIKIKLLNTYSYGFQSISNSYAIKKKQTITLLTQPVTSNEDQQPLRFISRLKNVLYSSLMNHKDDVTAITEMIYGKVYRYTQFDVWKNHKDTMLEHSLRVVEVCLDARKNKKLDHIKSMRGYINHAIEKELTAYVVSQQEKLLPKVSPSTQQKILEVYANADEKKSFYESQLDLFYR